MEQTIYEDFLKEIKTFIPEQRLYLDPLRLLAYGTDAGFYRLIPKMIVCAENEKEVSQLLSSANRLSVPVTFRAAGTSLSGQSISDSVLIIAAKLWEGYELSTDKLTMRLQPGIVGVRVNEILKPHGRLFSPDPASLKSAMVGGIIMNNASGMNCGIHANSDRIILSVRMVFADGTILDTGSAASKDNFLSKHGDFIESIESIRDRINIDKELKDKIIHKYSIKCVTGLNLLPFVLYTDPFEIITHLLVGSEGTLAFLSEANVKTAIDLPFKASSMMYFKTTYDACLAVQILKEGPVAGAELLDYKALKAVKDKPGIPAYLKEFPEGVTALLVETKADSQTVLNEQINHITQLMSKFETVIPIVFTDKENEYSQYWSIRSGIFPSVGGMREPGTTTLIEDVAFHLEDLPQATIDLQYLLTKHGYHEGVIYGHALEGNYHFILNQRFDTQQEVERYEALMNDVIKLVIDKYNGSLKAEHGTGRNMAPFVKYEWGEKAYEVMKKVKTLFDPKNMLNPGVIFNDDPHCHIKDFKPLPLTHPIIDKCIECGFCEVNCLTYGLTLSARQRIVIRREIARLNNSGSDAERVKTLEKLFAYYSNETCAGDGLCAISCPMNINTGHLIHYLREEKMKHNAFGSTLGQWSANHFSTVKSGLRSVLSLANTAHTILGTKTMTAIASGLHTGSKKNIPLWTPNMPVAYKMKAKTCNSSELKVVYFPSCINQTMGVGKESSKEMALVDKLYGLLIKSGYEVIFPDNMENLCCGTIWESKGMPQIADQKAKELVAALIKASENGKYPVLCDQSPCLYRMRAVFTELELFEPVEFIWKYLRERLDFHPIEEVISIHSTCSMRKMGLDKLVTQLASLCSTNVVVPEEVGCCGFAGDKGFTHPEVNRYALRKLSPQLKNKSVTRGYSNSRTCEIGLSTNGGVPYNSIVYLVDECTTRKN